MINHFIAFWNLENLFAPENHPDREPWLAQKLAAELNGWTEDLFETKIKQLTSIIQKINNNNGPDILGVCEVENEFVLKKLSEKLNQTINNRNYSIVHVDSTKDQRGIDTAFIYDQLKYTVDPNTIFSYFVLRRTGTRDITQVTFTTKKANDLIALCNHWPSRSGGTYESRGYRMTAGETLSYWHERIWEVRGNEIPIIAMGDFNDDPFDDSILIHARATRERGDVERAITAARYYNLTWNYLKQTANDINGNQKELYGTLYYNGNGNIFDQIFVSKGLLIPNSPIKVDEDSAQIELFSEMIDSSVSKGPIRFGLPKGDANNNINTSGFSDHFPVSVVLNEKE
ncbi:endonuclease/exonuclease/phosphatase family protein [Bacteroidota bacterium]